MRHNRSPFPLLESLESLLSPSTVFPKVGIPSPPVNAGAEIAVANHSRDVELRGMLNGTWSQVSSNPDAGSQQTLIASGTIHPLGMVNLSGSLQLPGFIENGHTQGTIQLQGSRGTLTISVVGPPFISPGGGPSKFDYHILSGTNHYAHATGSGTLQLTEAQLIAPTPVGLPISSQPPYDHFFELTFHPHR